MERWIFITNMTLWFQIYECEEKNKYYEELPLSYLLKSNNNNGLKIYHLNYIYIVIFLLE